MRGTIIGWYEPALRDINILWRLLSSLEINGHRYFDPAVAHTHVDRTQHSFL